MGRVNQIGLKNEDVETPSQVHGKQMQFFRVLKSIESKVWAVRLGQSKEFPIAPHFYPICFGKCCPPVNYKPPILDSMPSYVFFE
jgi:hypothetical protein